MTAHEKMTQRLTEWRNGLEVMEHKLTELTLAIERQRGAIAAAEAMLAMADDEAVRESTEEATADAPTAEQAT